MSISSAWPGVIKGNTQKPLPLSLGTRREHHDEGLLVASRPPLEHHEHPLVRAAIIKSKTQKLPMLSGVGQTHGENIMSISWCWPGVLVFGRGIPASGGPVHNESFMSISLSRPGDSHEESITQQNTTSVLQQPAGGHAHGALCLGITPAAPAS